MAITTISKVHVVPGKEMETIKCNRIENKKCRICILLFILSLVLGKIALIVIVYPNVALLIYIIGWVVLLGGIILCGKQGWQPVKHLYKKYEIEIFEFLKRKISQL